MQADIKELRELLDLKDEFKEKEKEASEMRKLSYKANDRARKRLEACIEKDKEMLNSYRESIKEKKNSFMGKTILIPEEYKDNNIGGLVDHSCFNDLPTGVKFTIDGFPSDWITLRARGYGIIDKNDDKSYGNGSLSPSLRELIEFFEFVDEGKKKKKNYKRMWGDLKHILNQYGKLKKIMTDIEDEYE